MPTYTLADGTLLCWTTFEHHHDHATSPVRVGMYWSPVDPLLVRLEIVPKGTSPARWLVGRDVLIDGLAFVSGYGEIKVWPASPTTVGVWMTNQSGEAEFSVALDVLRDFLAATLHRLPRGREFDHVDMDYELARLSEAA